MKRIRLKKRKKISFINYIILIIFFLIVSVILAFSYISNIVTPKVQNYAEQKAKRIISLVLSQSLTDEIIDLFEDESLFVTNKNGDGSVSSIDFNSIVVNKIYSKVSKNVKTYLNKLEKGEISDLGLSDNTLFNVSEKDLKNGIIYEIPSGIIFKNALLENIGPKIPVKLSFLGNVTTDIVTNISDYGINNAIVEIGIKIVVIEQVILPFNTSQVEIETIIPITIKLVQGTVPNYYFNGTNTPSLSLSTQ